MTAAINPSQLKGLFKGSANVVNTAKELPPVPQKIKSEKVDDPIKVESPSNISAADPLAEHGEGIFKKPAGVATSSDPSKKIEKSPSPDNAHVEAKVIEQPAREIEKEPAQPKKSGLRQARESKTEAAVSGQDAKIIMNSFKVFSPLVAAMTFNPGKSGTFEHSSEAIKLMNAELDKLVRAMCKIVEVDILDEDKQWVVAGFRVVAAEHIGNQWKRNPDIKSFSADPYIEAFGEIAKNMLVQPTRYEDISMTDSMHIHLSLMKSMVPVIKEYSLYENVVASMIPGYKVDRESLFSYSAHVIQDAAGTIVASFGLKPTDESHRIAYQSMLNCCGSVMSGSVAYACDRMLEKLDSMNTAGRVDFFKKSQANKNEILVSLDDITADFTSSMKGLVAIAKQSSQVYAAQVAESTQTKKSGHRFG